MTIKEQIAVMQGYADGKQIQVFDAAKGRGTWINVEKPSWNFGFNEYRIKPEEQTYRSYESTDEMIDDFNERFGVDNSAYNLPLIWVKHKNTGIKYLVITFYEYLVSLDRGNYNIDALFDEFTYLDESPCGKLVE